MMFRELEVRVFPDRLDPSDWRVEAFDVEDGGCDARLWEIAENLHRADLTDREKTQHIAEWVKLTADKEAAKVYHGDTPLGGIQPTESWVSTAPKHNERRVTEQERSYMIAAAAEHAAHVRLGQ